jgi:peptidyl-prolyl cis-trans isomerase A (cyclophilin A)
MRLSTNLLCFLAVSMLGFLGLNSAQAQEGAAEEVAAEDAKEASADKAKKGNTYEYALIKTDKGDIVVRLNETLAPISTANFLSYAKEGAYNDTIFHRVIDGFMIQGGGFGVDLEKRPTNAPIVNEVTNGLRNDRYTIAMARTNDPNSATNQFYINVNNNNQLNGSPGRPGYAVFGHVIAGIKVVDEIRQTPKTNRGGAFTDSPSTPIVIKSVARIDKAEAEKLVVADGGKASAVTEPTPNEIKASQPKMDLTTTDVKPDQLPGMSVDRPADGEENGLKWWVLEAGADDAATPQNMNDTVKVHYTGYLLDGTKFDSSVDRGDPIEFPLDKVIPGWTMGVSKMKIGEKKKLLIPATPWGYGARGAGGVIPPNATLVFDVELLGITPGG